MPIQKEECGLKMSLWAKTATGKWAANLSILFLVLIGLKMTLAFPLPDPLIVALGTMGFLLGLVSILVKKDRALLTVLSLPVGMVIIAWAASEIALLR